jgi:hypothetical protein
MADKIVLDQYYGETILVAGKCWQFIGLDDSSFTHSSGDISAFYADCNDCLTGGIPLEWSDISGSLLGDPHYIFGGSSPETASFNFDDNSGTDEVVWFTALDASSNEIIVKYRCQEFVNTVDGYSVDRLIIEDGTVSSVYEVSPDNSDVLKNGIIWNDSDSNIILGDNVWKMNISSVTVPSCPGDFSWIPFEFSPMSGMHSVQSIGGMWWTAWKKAASLSATTINNPSSAGFDGVSAFLDGFDGYSSRSDFSATPSSLRETFDQVTMNEIVIKRNELALQTGSVDFGWDPTMDSPPSCTSGFLACGTPNANPTMFVKLEWSGGPSTRQWLNCTWSNNQTREVYSTSYTAPTMHQWQRNTMGGNLSFQNQTVFTSVPSVAYLQIACNLNNTESAYFYVTRATNGNPTAAFGGTIASNFGTPINSASWMQLTDAGYINTSFNGNATSTGGIKGW